MLDLQSISNTGLRQDVTGPGSVHLHLASQATDVGEQQMPGIFIVALSPHLADQLGVREDLACVDHRQNLKEILGRRNLHFIFTEPNNSRIELDREVTGDQRRLASPCKPGAVPPGFPLAVRPRQNGFVRDSSAPASSAAIFVDSSPWTERIMTGF